ncbi:hypothetical protein [Massilia sp. H6]|uniref:hypothetical protein n=1 Tax=Massilia sp. H6 TaxID=2970464 RepID=UPI002169BEB5|nr:hypothetical protein [Massilia sp. H6]UVW28050.1 hypothetical protein NRS07_16140 [Massilia sp. H6]
MEPYLFVFRGSTIDETEGPEHDPARWEAWFESLGSSLLDRGAMSHGSIEVPSRLLGPKLSSSALSGYSIVAASSFNDAVGIAEACPIFDEKGSVEIARLR